MNPYMTDAQPDLECARDDLQFLELIRDHALRLIDGSQRAAKYMINNTRHMEEFWMGLDAMLADEISPCIKQCEDAIEEAAGQEELQHEEHQRLAHLAGLL